MNPRIIGLVLLLLGACLAYFTASADTAKLTGLAFAAIAGCGLYQLVFGFTSFGAAFSNLGSDNPSLVRRIGGVLVLAAGVLAVVTLGGGKAEELKMQELTQNGVVATAMITDGYESKRRRGGTTYNLKVKYTDQAGADHEIEKGVSQSEYENAAIGMPVEIIYSSQKPEVMEVLFNETDKAKYGK